MKKIFDLDQAPFAAVWETTQTCDPDYCLVTGQPERDPLELTTNEAEKMIRDLAGLHPPVFVLAGGNPLDREDIYSLVGYAASCGLHPTMVLAAGPALARNEILKLKKTGLSRLGLVLDSSLPEVHDDIHGHGSFARTFDALRWSSESRLPVQIHTTLNARNLEDLEEIVALLSLERVLVWSVSFPVDKEEWLSAEKTEKTFARLLQLSRLVTFKVKTVEAPHYHRFVLQQRAQSHKDHPGRSEKLENGIPGVMPVCESRGSIFISNTGEIYPSACLPASAGNVKTQKVSDIYLKSELFTSLRDVANLHGKCGRCSFKEICGGSRARALAIAGDMFAEDATCIYEPSVGPTAPGTTPSL